MFFLVENRPIQTPPLLVENFTIFFLTPFLREATHTFVAYVRPMQFVGWYPDKKQIGQNKKKATKCKTDIMLIRQNAKEAKYNLNKMQVRHNGNVRKCK